MQSILNKTQLKTLSHSVNKQKAPFQKLFVKKIAKLFAISEEQAKSEIALLLREAAGLPIPGSSDSLDSGLSQEPAAKTPDQPAIDGKAALLDAFRDNIGPTLAKVSMTEIQRLLKGYRNFDGQLFGSPADMIRLLELTAKFVGTEESAANDPFQIATYSDNEFADHAWQIIAAWIVEWEHSRNMSVHPQLKELVQKFLAGTMTNGNFPKSWTRKKDVPPLEEIKDMYAERSSLDQWFC